MIGEPTICPEGEHDFEIGRLGDSRTAWNLCTKCPYHEPIYDSGEVKVIVEVFDSEGNRVQ